VILAAASFLQEGVATTMYHQLTQEERYLIAVGLRLRSSHRQLARELGRAPSTVGREIRRNATAHDGAYRGEKAHSYAVARRRRSRRGPQFTEAVLNRVDDALRQRWSPEQIVGTFRADGERVPSHETIYRRVRRDRRAGGDLFRFTRIMSKVGRKRYRSRPTRGVLLGKRHITERAAVVETRARIGDWEGDTVVGCAGSSHCILTLVDRKSGFALIRKLSARNMAEVTDAAATVIGEMPEKFTTLTFDNGTEFHDYETLEHRFDVTCYFATPYHSWERGSNENLNGLIRQYLPKGLSLRTLTQETCDLIALDLNTRPRKRHAFKTPNHVFSQSR
jgi:transposase, IS30 family